MDFVNLPTETLDVKTKTINQKKVDIDLKYFLKNDIIIISSGTATGKTKDVAKKSKDILLHYPDCRILSIVNLISLACEQSSTFKEEGTIALNNYQKVDFKLFKNENLVICINSLEKILKLGDDYFSNTILYIDEVNNLIETLTHNKILDSSLNIIYACLIKLIKNAKKIIFTDATINQNTLNLLSSRTSNNKTILIKNVNQKYEGINAIKCNDANNFLQSLKDKIKNKEYFLFGCDICSKITSFYNDLINEFPEQKEDFILITSKTNFYLHDASSQFEDKYVFYSPSITTGVSFVNAEKSQTQFIYISGQSVNPIGIYQMASRTRNMKELIYHCEDIAPQKMKCQTQDELEIRYKKMVETNDKILRLSQSINKFDETEIVENTYFKLFCYNEFLADIFKTDFLQHFQNILINNGFNLKEFGEIKNLHYAIKRKHKILMEKIQDDEIKEYIKLVYDEEIEDDVKGTFLEILRPKINLELFKKRDEILGLENKEQAMHYKIFLQDEHALTNLFNFQKLFKTEEFITNKVNQNYINCPSVKNLFNTCTKVNLLRLFEKVYNIDRLDLNFTNISMENNLTDDEINLITKVYRSTKSDLSTIENIIKSYINMLTHICGDIPIIISSQKGKKKLRVYEINKELLIDLLTLTKFKNPYLKTYDKELIKKLSGIEADIRPPKQLETANEYKEVEEIYNTYLFGKFGNKK